MGAFVKLADMAEQKVAPDLMKKVWATSFSMETAMKQSKGGTALLDMFQKQFHPQVDKETLQVINNARSMGSNMTPGEIKGMAKQQAREKVFGKNDEIIQGLVKHIEKEKGPVHAQNIVDHINVHLADAPSGPGAQVGQSRLDRNLSRKTGPIQTTQKPMVHPQTGTPFMKTVKSQAPGNQFQVQHSTVYEPPTNIEHAIKQYTTMTFAAKAVVPHTATQLNVALQHGVTNYFKAIASVISPSGFDSAKQMLIAHGQLSEIAMMEYEQEYAFKNGKIKNYAPGSVGAWLQRNYSMPGMSGLRKWSVVMAGVASKLSAEEAAVRWANGDNSILPVLKEFDLDPSKIRAQGGKLLPEDYHKAYYHGINNSVFLQGSSGLSRTRAAQSTMLGRLTTTFHTYTTRQAGLIRRVLYRDIIERKDPVAAARTLAMLGVVFPTVGNAIYGLEQISRGKDWDDPTGKFEKREAKMYGADGFVDAILQHIDAISNTASFGVATSYGRGIGRFHLLNQMAGPLLNTAADLVQDSGKLLVDGIKTASGGEFQSGPVKQLGRDIIQDTPMMGANTAIKHRLLPTKQEENAAKPKTAKQMKAALRRRMKNKKGTSFFDYNSEN